MEEQWRPVPTYESLYEASDAGRIRRVPGWTISTIGRRRFFNGGVLKPIVDGTGYATVNLLRNGKRAHFGVHILVMWAFTGVRSTRANPINHLDGNKRNPALSNLELTTVSGNGKHAFATGLQKPKHGEQAYGAKLTAEQVVAILALRGAMSQRRIAALFGVSHQLVSDILNGKRRAHG